MRFNDLLQTVLAAEHRSGLGAVTLWRQCVDLLAQNDLPGRTSLAEAERSALLDRMGGLRRLLSETQRIATVVELGARLRSPTLVEFFAHDRPAITAAAISRARLPDAVWVEMLPRLTPTARGILRGRRDIGPETRRALEAFGAADLVLTSEGAGALDMAEAEDMLLTPDMILDAPPSIEDDLAEAEVDADEATPDIGAGEHDQIRNLVDRIARFTSNRRFPDTTESGAEPDAATPRTFAFETDASGVVIWVDQGPRAALIGLMLGETALAGGSGPDGHVAGAFKRRSGFQNARYVIVGGRMAGEWRMSATPFFDTRSGRFQGYRGQARRPYLHEIAASPPTESLAIAGLSADSLRQLVHELRTPLNAILGFAEIIEQELFGPVGTEYREMGGKIAVDARHLLAAFDDLDLAARVSRGETPDAPRAVDPALLVAQISARFSGQDEGGGTDIEISMAPDLPPVRVDPVQGERMVQHLLRTLVSVASASEPLTGVCWFQPDSGQGRVILAIDRPSTLMGMEEQRLLDPGYTPEGDWADGPLLGLGFSLRLIRSLAAGCGGALEIEPSRFLLAMPAITEADGAAGSA